MPQPELTPDEQELIGYACKAAGLVPDELDEHGAWIKGEADPIVGAWSKFNPLASNGDAFALGIQLRMVMEISDDGLEAYAASPTGHHWTVVTDTGCADHASALRCAITTCAALVGGHEP